MNNLRSDCTTARPIEVPRIHLSRFPPDDLTTDYVRIFLRFVSVTLTESCTLLYTSATEVMFSSAVICLFVTRITQKNYSINFHKIRRKGWPPKRPLDFW